MQSYIGKDGFYHSFYPMLHMWWRFRSRPSLNQTFKSRNIGAPGWLSGLSLLLQLRSRSHGLWVRAPSRALGWWLRDWSLLPILCLPLSLPRPCSFSLSLSLPPSLSLSLSLSLSQKWTHITIFLMLIVEREREKQGVNGGGAERGRYRIWSRLQALSHQHRAQCRAWTHEPLDNDLSRSRTLSQVSHPGAPIL